MATGGKHFGKIIEGSVSNKVEALQKDASDSDAQVHIYNHIHIYIYIFIIIYIYHTGKVSTLGFHNLTKLPSLLPQNIAVVGLPYTMVYPNLFQKSSIYDSSLESQCYFYIICIIDIQVIIGNIVNHHQ